MSSATEPIVPDIFNPQQSEEEYIHNEDGWLEDLIRRRGEVTHPVPKTFKDITHSLVEGTETDMEYVVTTDNGDIYEITFSANKTTLTLNNKMMTTFHFEKNEIESPAFNSSNRVCVLKGLEDTCVTIEHGMTSIEFAEHFGEVAGSYLTEENSSSNLALAILHKAADIWWNAYVVPFRAHERVLFPEEFETNLTLGMIGPSEIRENISGAVITERDDLIETERFSSRFRKSYIEYVVKMESRNNVIPSSTVGEIPESPMYFHLLTQLDSPRLSDPNFDDKLKLHDNMLTESNRYLALKVLDLIDDPYIDLSEYDGTTGSFWDAIDQQIVENVDETPDSLIRKLRAGKKIPNSDVIIRYLVRERTDLSEGNWIYNERANRWQSSVGKRHFISQEAVDQARKQSEGVYPSLGYLLDELVSPDPNLKLGGVHNKDSENWIYNERANRWQSSVGNRQFISQKAVAQARKQNYDSDSDFMNKHIPRSRMILASLLESITKNSDPALFAHSQRC